MKDIKLTLLELVHHIIGSHPEMRSNLEQIIFQEQGKNLFDANLLLTINHDLLKKSKAQLRQDIFVLSELGFKREGFFIEFGATNGINLSNTFMLEKEYSWSGILVEPAKLWHHDLENNRSCIIDRRCVWKKSGEMILFNETHIAELSTIDAMSNSDHHAKAREIGQKYMVESITLMDLLEQYNAPYQIDYLSIDTEGSEYQILENFDFNRYRINVITCEHNFSPMRAKLAALFEKNGYHRKHEHLSQFDDWWVKAI